MPFGGPFQPFVAECRGMAVKGMLGAAILLE
jgi:hypothetical protein